MNPYIPYLEHVDEYEYNLDEFGKTPYENAMFNLLDESERHYVADWAVRHKISADDPIWHHIELSMLTNRWAQETLCVMKEESEELTAHIRAVTEQSKARLKSESQAISRDIQFKLTDAIQDIGRLVSNDIASATGANVATEMRVILRHSVPGIVAAVILMLVMFGGSLLYTSRFAASPLTKSQQKLLDFGQQVKSQYYALSAQQQADMDLLMGWNQQQEQ